MTTGLKVVDTRRNPKDWCSKCSAVSWIPIDTPIARAGLGDAAVDDMLTREVDRRKKEQKTSRVYMAAVIVIGIALLGVVSIYLGPAGNNASQVQPEKPNLVMNPETYWSYDESPDKIGRGTKRNAFISSVNEVQFGFPYQNSQRATLQFRIHPQYGKDVILNIERGQFLCGLEGCTVSVRFDDGKPQAYSAEEPADYSTTHLFIRNYDRFLASTRKAKKVYIEAHFYQEASRVFEFDVAGLKW